MPHDQTTPRMLPEWLRDLGRWFVDPKMRQISQGLAQSGRFDGRYRGWRACVI